jgi:hypothetical protein
MHKSVTYILQIAVTVFLQFRAFSWRSSRYSEPNINSSRIADVFQNLSYIPRDDLLPQLRLPFVGTAAMQMCTIDLPTPVNCNQSSFATPDSPHSQGMRPNILLVISDQQVILEIIIIIIVMSYCNHPTEALRFRWYAPRYRARAPSNWAAGARRAPVRFGLHSCSNLHSGTIIHCSWTPVPRNQKFHG